MSEAAVALSLAALAVQHPDWLIYPSQGGTVSAEWRDDEHRHLRLVICHSIPELADKLAKITEQEARS